MRASTGFVVMGLLAATFASSGLGPWGSPLAAWAPAAAAAPAAGGMPLAFEPNLGQSGRGAYVARGPGYAAAFAPDGVAFRLAAGDQGAEVAMRFVGASPATLVAEGQLPGVSRYYRGADAGAWLNDVPRFERLALHGLWPGIGMVFYADADQLLEYDVVVAPGADLGPVRLAFEGAAPRLAPDGALVLGTAAGELRQRAPVAYQLVDAARVPVASAFRLHGDGTVGFTAGPHDPARPLVIDPVLLYSQRIGGTYNASIPNPLGNGNEYAHGIAIDSFGSAYIMGATTSVDFPLKDPVQNVLAGYNDIFVAKFDPFGVLQYSTYLGGSQNNTLVSGLGYYSIQDLPHGGIAVNAAGEAYVTSASHSVDFPLMRPYQAQRNGGYDAVLVKLDPQGRLLRSTYFGGTGFEGPAGIGIDDDGHVYVGGMTTSTDLPATPGAAQPASRGSYEGWSAKFDPHLETLLYLTYFGGSSHEYIDTYAVDPMGHAYLAGPTASTDLPRTNAWQPRMVAGAESFLVRIAPDGRSFVYSTYLGAWSDDLINDVAADAAGNAYVVGSTSSTGLEIKGNAVQPLHAGGAYDGFLAKYGPTGALLYSTYLGGSFDDRPLAVAVDGKERAHVTGWTSSTQVTFPLKDPYDAAYSYLDGFITRIDTKAPSPTASLGFSTYFGYNPTPRAIAVDFPGNIYLTGHAGKNNVPNVNSSVPDAPGNKAWDAFLAAFIEQCGAPPTTTASAAGLPGNAGWLRSDAMVTLTARSLSCPVPFTYYRLDGGAQAQGRLIPVRNDGIHTLTFHSVDLLGGVETPVKSFTVKLDATPPVTKANLAGAPGVGCWFRSPVAVTLAATDATSGVAPGETRYSLDGKPWVKSTTLGISASGVHDLQFGSQDVAGNAEPPKATTICLDYVPPTVDLLRPTGGNVYAVDVEDPLRGALPETVVVGTLEVRADAMDDFSGVHRVELWVDGALRDVDHSPPFSFAWRAGAEAAGRHTLSVRAYDMAGNTAEDGLSVLTVPTRPEGALATTDGLSEAALAALPAEVRAAVAQALAAPPPVAAQPPGGAA